jgi:outer membrane receptor protein involved in Fe transport
LYGSDAIGAVINVLTRKPPIKAEIDGSLEAGSYGWRRAMVTGGNTFDNQAFRADLNLTHTDGWREQTAYDRQSATLRWDSAIGNEGLLKTVATFSNINQETAGSSGISESDFQNNPRTNYTPISLRKVQAFRLSSAYEQESGDSLFSITPYFRYDNMDLLPNWSLAYDPTRYTTENTSLGALIKYRQDFAPLRTRLIVGLDLDNSPGSRVENSISTTSVGSGYTRIFTNYSIGPRIYDYDVTYRGIAPYIHGEFSPLERLRVTAGLRYDSISYNYSNNLGRAPVVASGRYYGQVADTDIDFTHLSPKFGVTYAFSDALNGFFAYNNAFRAPSEGQLFRPAVASSVVAAQAAAAAAQKLEPIVANSLEVGLRGMAGSAVNYEISLYHMTKKDDILNFRDTVTNVTTPVNAGETLHRGVEIGVGAQLASLWRFDTAYSYAKHTYEQWQIGNVDYSGKEMELAPRTMANTRLTFGNKQTGLVQLEWLYYSTWWSDQANTLKYSGHSILNLRGQYPVARDIDLFATVHNLTDYRYAESTGTQTSNGVIYQTYAPGLPITLTMGIQAKW